MTSLVILLKKLPCRHWHSSKKKVYWVKGLNVSSLCCKEAESECLFWLFTVLFLVFLPFWKWLLFLTLIYQFVSPFQVKFNMCSYLFSSVSPLKCSICMSMYVHDEMNSYSRPIVLIIRHNFLSVRWIPRYLHLQTKKGYFYLFL